MNTLITAKDNSQVKALKRLLHQAKRHDTLMAVEGIHACQLFLHNQARHRLALERVWVGEAAWDNAEIQALCEQARRQSVRVLTLGNAVFRDISGLTQGVSVVFEVERPLTHRIDVVSAEGDVLLLDGIQDPGNMGSILRTCAAAGVAAVYLNDQCVNPYAPKVLRASVGAQFGLNIIEDADFDRLIPDLQQHGITVCATAPRAEQSIYQYAFGRTAWLMGNEGAGLSVALQAAADVILSIPMAAGESLNVAAATAVCLFERVRQKAQTPSSDFACTKYIDSSSRDSCTKK